MIKHKKVVLFDIVTHMGGAQMSMVEFISALKHRVREVEIIDAYGTISEYREWIKRLGIPYTSLLNNARYTNIGYTKAPLIRAIKIMLALPELLHLRNLLDKKLNEDRPDYIIVTSYKALRILVSTPIGRDIKIIFWCRGELLPQTLLKQNILPYVYRFLCLNKSISEASGKNGFPFDKLRIVPNAVDIEKIINQAQNNIESLPFKNKTIKLLLPATILPTKGQECAILALKKLIDSGYDAILYLAGDYGKNNNSYKNILYNLIQKNDLINRVLFLGWRKDVPQLMLQSDVVLLPSHSEGVPRCIMEAMVLKVPIIATPVGGIPELLNYGECGTLIEINDHLGLSNAIINVVNGKYMGKVDKAFDTVKNNYCRNSQVESFIKAMNN